MEYWWDPNPSLQYSITPIFSRLAASRRSLIGKKPIHHRKDFVMIIDVHNHIVAGEQLQTFQAGLDQ